MLLEGARTMCHAARGTRTMYRAARGARTMLYHAARMTRTMYHVARGARTMYRAARGARAMYHAARGARTMYRAARGARTMYHAARGGSTFKVSPLNLMNSMNIFCALNEKKCGPDVLCLQETWKIPDSSVFNIQGYSELFVKSRHSKQGGGVGFYFKNSVKFKLVNEKSIFVDQILESIVAEIFLPCNKKAVVLSIYRHASNHPP